jgi:hypothetical protein
MKSTQAIFTISFISFVTFQNCGGNKVAFTPVEDAVEQSQSVDPIPEQPSKEIEIEFKDKDLFFYGTRINGHLALVASLNQPSSIPLTISLKKSCGSIDDSQIAGNGEMGKFIFTIPAGQKESAPVILSAFPTGQIVWSVQINVTGSNAPVTDVLQTCSPWLQSGGGSLCPSPIKQPYCIDRGA